MSLAGESQRRRALAAGALIFVAFACTAGLRPLMLPDEGRYVGVAWEMLGSGDWLTPTLNGLPFFHKPPLFYWITAASLSVFGTNEWAARVAPILGAWLGAFGMYLFVCRWRSERTAVLVALALVVQPLQFVGGQFANLDMLVSGFVTVTILLIAHAALSLEAGQPYRGALIAAYGSAALGMLAKGLLAIALPGLVVGGWLLLRGRWRLLGRLVLLPGVLVFSAIAVPWFVAMQLRFDAFFDYFFVEQHVRRYFASGYNNALPFWFFPAALLVMSLPWLPWLAHGLWRWRAEPRRQDPVMLLMVTWIVIVVAFFSVPRSKLVGYVLPAIPPLAYLLAAAWIDRPLARRLWYASAVASALISLGAVMYFAANTTRSSRELALRLGAERLPDEPIFMLARYNYDVSFYARLHVPIRVVDDWSRQDLRASDNWRKELLESGDFRPDAARQRLVDRKRLQAMLCDAPTSWIIGSTADAHAYPFLARAEVAWSRRGTTLWRVRRDQLIAGDVLPCLPNDDAPAAER